MMFSAKNVKRSAGKSIVGAVAYRTGTRLEDVQGNVFDFTPRSKSKSVVCTKIFAPMDCPEWATDRELLWNKADAAEKRCDAVTGREFVLNLPHELSEQGRVELLTRFSREIVTRHGCVVDAAVHKPDRKGDPRNHHAHLMLSTRRLTPEGFGKKTRELDCKKDQALEKLRETWAAYTNEALAKAGYEERIDHRSYERQGIDRKPGLHVGSYASELERDGVQTQRGNYNRKIAELNAANPLVWTLNGWTKQQEIAQQAADLRAELMRKEQAAAERMATMQRSGGMIKPPPKPIEPAPAPKPIEPPTKPRSHEQIERLIELARASGASTRDEPPIWAYCHPKTIHVLRHAAHASRAGLDQDLEHLGNVERWKEIAANDQDWREIIDKDIRRLDPSYTPERAAERKEDAQERDDYEPPTAGW